MTKTVPKQKPLATKKNKLPMTILSLLGLALLLVGIISVIGLMQINQDGRSQANEDNDRIQAKIEADRKRNKENERDRKLGQPVELRGYCGDGQNSGMIMVDFKNKDGGADKYVTAFNSNKYVPGSADCPSPALGWMCDGDNQVTSFVKSNGSVEWKREYVFQGQLLTAKMTIPARDRGYEKDRGCDIKKSLCSEGTFTDKGHTYDTIAVRAFKNGQNKVSQINVNLKCR